MFTTQRAEGTAIAAPGLPIHTTTAACTGGGAGALRLVWEEYSFADNCSLLWVPKVQTVRVTKTSNIVSR